MDKVKFTINGNVIPGLVASAPEPRTIVLQPTATRPTERRIETRFYKVISLRTPNPAGPNAGDPAYLAVSFEDERFLFNRAESVVGLDADENGAVLTLQSLEDQRMAQQAARQVALATPVVQSLD
jgi:hypothetical protein